MPKPSFTTANDLAIRIDAYFKHIEGTHNQHEKPKAETREPVPTLKKNENKENEPTTIAGLALFLGFNSLKAFDNYERKGRFASALKRGRLRVEAAYEKRLHHQSSTGSVFALKSMGWGENEADDPNENKVFKNIKVNIVDTGPKPAGNEKEVVL